MDLKLQVGLLVTAVMFVRQQTMEAVVQEDLAVLAHLMAAVVEVVDTLEVEVLMLEEEVVVPAIPITLQSAPLVSIQAMDMRLLSLSHQLPILQLHRARFRRLSRLPLLLHLQPLHQLQTQR